MQSFKSYRQSLAEAADLLEAGKETFQLDKGLTREEARKQTIKRIKGDHRGFSYNPKTGMATYI